MTFVAYLLIGFVALLAIVSWITYAAFRRAEEGGEDALGFYLGDQPRLIPSVPVVALTPDAVASSPTTASLSPFEKQCAITRAQANQVESADPFGGVLGQKSPDSKV